MPVPLTGQIAVSGSAQALSATPVNATAYTIKAPASNLKPVFIGASAVTLTTGFQLDPGDSVDYGRSDQHGQPRLQLQISDYWVVGTAPDVVSWLASP